MWRRHYYSSSLDPLWGDNCSSLSSMKLLGTWRTSGLSTTVGSSSGLHKVSSSIYLSTWYLITISNTLSCTSSISFTSGTFQYVYFGPIEQLFNWYHFLDPQGKLLDVLASQESEVPQRTKKRDMLIDLLA